MDSYIKSEWTHWMKELAAGRTVPNWFRKNLDNIHETMESQPEASTLSPQDIIDAVKMLKASPPAPAYVPPKYKMMLPKPEPLPTPAPADEWVSMRPEE